jgi:hypothetical protein
VADRYWTGPHAELSVCCEHKFRHKETDHGDEQTTFASLDGFDETSRAKRADRLVDAFSDAVNADEQARIDDLVDRGVSLLRDGRDAMPDRSEAKLLRPLAVLIRGSPRGAVQQIFRLRMLGAPIMPRYVRGDGRDDARDRQSDRDTA